jgi:hypothetical protein
MINWPTSAAPSFPAKTHSESNSLNYSPITKCSKTPTKIGDCRWSGKNPLRKTCLENWIHIKVYRAIRRRWRKKSIRAPSSNWEPSKNWIN